MVTKLIEFTVIFIIAGSVGLMITYFVVCAVETLQKLNNKRR